MRHDYLLAHFVNKQAPLLPDQAVKTDEVLAIDKDCSKKPFNAQDMPRLESNRGFCKENDIQEIIPSQLQWLLDREKDAVIRKSLSNYEDNQFKKQTVDLHD